MHTISITFTIRVGTTTSTQSVTRRLCCESSHLSCGLHVIDLHLNKLLLIQIMDNAHPMEVIFARNPTGGPMLVWDNVPHPNADRMQTPNGCRCSLVLTTTVSQW